ncbi:thiol reductant ABC exporter subunit CydD [Haloechinothrix sp. LS1_15]|uniref:thiol reductant ABC exporter subunit CydD n=1 Tax=Haloechinothrix sp. LS1_15 TaxID=2652248 RepID=UPI0029464B9B|nr:thiol reductant ABC exporter subunit CydD [Haloechinothrix sp. LS1_15]MDV6014518.1 thiol reductant ABC exporter subunit CydD [Haloechinothrix sp. LS1_15]
MLLRRPRFPVTLSVAGSSKGPLGALPALSAVARRALLTVGALALANALLLIAQAFLLAFALAGVVAGTSDGLDVLLPVLVGVVVARAGVVWATRSVAARAAAGAKEELRGAMLDRALGLGPEWAAARGTGELASLTTRGLDALDRYFTEYLPALVTACVVPPVAGAAVLYADWPSAVIIALTLPLLPVFGALVGAYTRDRVAASVDAEQRLSGQLLELVRALPVLAAFGRARAQGAVVHRLSDRHRRSARETLKVAFSSAFVLELAATLSVALVAVVIGVRLVSGDMALAIGLGVLILAPECYQPLRTLGAAFHSAEDGLEASRRVADVLDEQPGGRAEDARGERGEPAAERPVGQAAGGGPRGPVRVRGLRVARRAGFAPDGESFEAHPGRITHLRSPSGAGKSTTLAVLLGFVVPSAGTVLIGDTDLRHVDLSTWRRQVAWVPQFPTLPASTAREELADAAADLPHDPGPAAIEEVAAELGLAGLLDRAPHALSTGQRQRLAVARALLRVRAGAWLLLLDEPTAHLDEAHAAAVMAAVGAAAQAGATVILAAHTAHQGQARQESGTGGESRAGAASHAGEGPPLALRELVTSRLLVAAALGAGALIAGVALTATSGWLIARASQQPPILMLMVAVVGVRTFGLARACLRYLERLVGHDAAFGIATRLRTRLWQSVVRRGPAAALDPRSGADQRRLVDDVDTLRDLLPRVVATPLVVTAVSLFAVAVTAVILPVAGLTLAAALAAGASAALAVAFARERRTAEALAEGRRAVGARVLALLDGMAELLAFGRARRARCELADVDGRLSALARRQELLAGAADGIVALATGSAAVLCAWWAAGAVATGELDPVLAPLLALVPLAMAEVLGLLPPAAAHAGTLDRVRRRIGPLSGEDGAELRRDPGGEDDGARPAGSVAAELSGVTVRWPGAAIPALHRVDLRIPRGEHIAVVGPSGAGKSTLLATLLGFLEPEKGAVRTSLGVVWAPQEPHLVATSLAENLRLADSHATEEQLVAALRTACLDELAGDLDRVLGSGGAGLSGGQAGRLSVARAVLAARAAGTERLVLLDEPAAHLDAETARLMLARLRAALAGHTVLSVTHDVEHAAGAEHVLDVSGGSVSWRTPLLCN